MSGGTNALRSGKIMMVALCIGACSGEAAEGEAACSRADCAGGGVGNGNDGSAAATNGGALGLSDPFAGDEAQVSALALDGDFLYWVAGPVLRRAPLAGGAPTTLARGQQLQNLAVLGEQVYFTDAAGTVSRVSRSGGDVEAIGGGESPYGLAVADGTVYWGNTAHSIDDGSIAAADLDGGNPRVLATGLAQPAGLVVHDGFVYFTSTSLSCFGSSEGYGGCTGGGVSRVSIAGGNAEVVDPQGTPFALVGDGTGLYWVRSSPRPGLMHTAYDGGGTVQLTRLVGADLGPLAVDADGVYVGTSDGVFQVPLEGGEAVKLKGDLSGTGGIVTRGDRLYVSEPGAGKIRIVAKDGSSNRPTGPIAGPCPAAIGSAEEIALTPRADTNLELLALQLEPERITSDQATYERVVADIAAIRALAPELADIDYRPPHDGKTVNVWFDDITTQSIHDGDYSAWNCLNEFYGPATLTIHEFTITNDLMEIELKGIYDVDRLAQLYAQLPGAEGASSNGSIGGGPTICAWRSGERYEYVIDRAGGDCPSGCTSHEAHHFASDPAGQVSALEVWQSPDSAPLPAPEWYTRVCL
jgi:hypothetical protein